MAGKRQRKVHRKIRKEGLIALVIVLTSMVITPLTPARDQPSPAAVAAASAPSKQIKSEKLNLKEEAKPVAETEELKQSASISKEAPEAAQKAAAEVAPKKPVQKEAVQKAPVPKQTKEHTATADPVADTYFTSAAFVGDSRTEGFHLYSGLKEGTYFFAVGATVKTVMDKETQSTSSGKQTIIDALSSGTYDKIYVMLGVNELGWYRTKDFTDQYGKVIDRIRKDHPKAKIAIESILPVSEKQDSKHSYVNNERIVLFNQLIKQLSEDKSCIWLDVASAVAGEDGKLPSTLTTDGVHLNSAGCKKWLEYLRSNPI